MARLFHESFDIMTPAQLQLTGLWTAVGSGIVSTTGRTVDGVTGTAGATQAENTLRTRAFVPAAGTTGYQGLAVKLTSLPASERKLWAVLDTTGTVLFTLTIRADGKVRIYRGTFESGTLLATSASAFVAAGAFRYLQVGHELAVTSNQIQVRSTNAGLVPPVTSLLVATPAGLTSALAWSRSEFYLDETIVIDDYYVNDGNTGIDPGYFSGDVSLVVLKPVTAVNHYYFFPWTPNSGSSLVDPVDETPHDGDLSYIFTREDFTRLQYVMETLADDGRTIDDVMAVAVARAVSSAWLPGFSFNWLRYDGLDSNGGFRNTTVTTSYQAFFQMVKGQGGLGGNLPWTFDHVNDSRFGMLG